MCSPIARGREPTVGTGYGSTVLDLAEMSEEILAPKFGTLGIWALGTDVELGGLVGSVETPAMFAAAVDAPLWLTTGAVVVLELGGDGVAGVVQQLVSV